MHSAVHPSNLHISDFTSTTRLDKVEAASARYAARDRFAFPGEPARTPLQRYIRTACDPANFEPNLALCMEITDHINSKKGTAPREAAIALLQHINNRNANISSLALNLLDICVKNCGYAFQLQISTKEFLNELVRRFPERPPMHLTSAMTTILQLIEEWRCTICVTSKYKEDLGFIRDMHRLLSYKGYVFPRVTREDAAVLNPSDNLRSVEEMEAEEHAAQSAKLQELIRRGTPRDLQEANKLMKVMAGFDQRNKTDYRAKAAEEVSRIQQKARLLEEMLQAFKPGDKLNDGDVSEELASALASAHPKIQKMCEEESDDTEAVKKLLEINDSIHRTIERYKLVKKGDVDAASKIEKGTLGISGMGVQKGPDNELSLIDFGTPVDQSNPKSSIPQDSLLDPPAAPPKGSTLEDDLLGLSFGNDSFPQGGGIQLGMSTNTSTLSMSTIPPPSSSTQIMSSTQKAPSQPSKPKPNYDPFSSFTSSQPAKTNSASTSGPTTSTTSSAFDLLGIASPPPSTNSTSSSTSLSNPANNNPTSILGPQTNHTISQPKQSDDEEWTFSSSLPESRHTYTLIDSSIKTLFDVSRPQHNANNVLAIKSRTSNTSSLKITGLTFQLAVTKGYRLSLEPQSTRDLEPKAVDGITQDITLHGVAQASGPSVRLRWRCAYLLHEQTGQKQVAEQGEIQISLT